MASDNPIKNPAQDTLGRNDTARRFAAHVMSLDAREGVVVAVLGPWGSGKTSFINLGANHFESEGVPVLAFNPWMFSGAEQLVDSFFVELASQLKLRPSLAELGKHLEEYGEAFSVLTRVPVIGPWVEGVRGASKMLLAILKRRREGIDTRRTRLCRTLAAQTKPIVVVLDDIDRLTKKEIRDVFRLVRLTASFPNIIYIVAFDRGRVELALADQGLTGRDYLEKILQFTLDLPVLPHEVLNSQVFHELDRALSGIDVGTLDERAWPDLFVEVIRPLIRTMRDVRRYALSVRGTLPALQGQVALADALALEAIRVFLPDVFALLHSSVDALTTPASGSDYRYNEAALKSQVATLVSTAGSREQVVKDLVLRLFPAAARHVGGMSYTLDWKHRWLRDRRVAHDSILSYYLERVLGGELQAFNDAERAWHLLHDQRRFDDYLRSLDASRLQDVIAALETYEDEFRTEHVVSGCVVLLNLLPDLPKRARGMFDFSTDLVVTRVVYRLLRAPGDKAITEQCVRQIYPQVRSLSSKLELVNDIGYREGQGHKLVSETAASEFEQIWLREVEASPHSALVSEHNPLKLLLTAKRRGAPDSSPLDVPDFPDLTAAVLREAQSEVISQSVDSRALRRTPRLAWEALVELYGDETTLAKRLTSLGSQRPDFDPDLQRLAAKYLAGWRPSD